MFSCYSGDTKEVYAIYRCSHWDPGQGYRGICNRCLKVWISSAYFEDEYTADIIVLKRGNVDAERQW